MAKGSNIADVAEVVETPDTATDVIETSTKPRLKAIKTKWDGEGKKLVVTFPKSESWTTGAEFQYRFVGISEGTQKDAQDAPNVVEAFKDDGTTATGDLTFFLDEATLKGLSFPSSKQELSTWLLQLKPKEEAGKETYEWATELNIYYFARVDMKLFKELIPLIAESDNPEYKIQKPVIIHYKNVREEYPSLPEKWGNGDEINSYLVLHELDYHTEKKTFNFAIEAEIGWEITAGVSVERAGFAVRMRDTTPQEHRKIEAAKETKRQALHAAEKTRLLAMATKKTKEDPTGANADKPTEEAPVE